MPVVTVFYALGKCT